MHVPGTKTFLTSLLKTILKRGLSEGVDVDESLVCSVQVDVYKLTLLIQGLHLHRGRVSLVGLKQVEVGATFWPPSLFARVREGFVDCTQVRETQGDDGDTRTPDTNAWEEEEEGGQGGEGDGSTKGVHGMPDFVMNPPLILRALLALVSLRVTQMHILLSQSGSSSQMMRVGKFVCYPHMSFWGRKVQKSFHASELVLVKAGDKSHWGKVVSSVVMKEGPGILARVSRYLISFLSFLSFLSIVTFLYDTRAILEGAGLQMHIDVNFWAKILFVSLPLASRFFMDSKVISREKDSCKMRVTLRGGSKTTGTGTQVRFWVPVWVVKMETKLRGEERAVSNVVAEVLVKQFKGEATLNSTKVKCSLAWKLLAIHSQNNFHEAFHSGAMVDGKYMGIEFSVKYQQLFIGTSATAKLLGFMSGRKKAPPSKTEDAPVKVLQLDVKCKNVFLDLGATGAQEDLRFRLGLDGDLEASGRYLGIEMKTYLKSMSLGTRQEQSIIRPTSITCHTRLGKEGGLELSPFSVLLSMHELRELMDVSEGWDVGSTEPGIESGGDQIDPYISGAVAKKSVLSSFRDKPILLTVPQNKETVALRCNLDLGQVYLGVDLSRCRACLSHLPPSFVDSELCVLFKVHKVRGTKFFMLALTAPGWEDFYLSKSGNGSDVSIRSLPHQGGSDFQFYVGVEGVVRCRSDRSFLNLTDSGLLSFHASRGKTEVGMVCMDTVGSTAVPASTDMQISFTVYVHILSRKDFKDESKSLVTEVHADEICRAILNAELKVGSAITNFQFEFEMLMGSVKVVRASRCWFEMGMLGSERVGSLFLWDPVEIQIDDQGMIELWRIMKNVRKRDEAPPPLVIVDKPALHPPNRKQQYSTSWTFACAGINFKIQDSILVGCITNVQGLAIDSDVELSVQRADIDSYHPNADSVVCLRTKSSLGAFTEQEMRFLYLAYSSCVAGDQKEISAHFSLAPLDLSINETVVSDVLRILNPYRKWSRSVGKDDVDKRKREEAATKIQKWFRKLRKSRQHKTRLRRTNSAKKIQRWWRKKQGKEYKPEKSQKDGLRYHIKVLDLHPIQVSAEYRSSRTEKLDYRQDDSILNDVGTILDVLGAPAVGKVDIRMPRILLRDVDMTRKDIAKVFVKNALKGSLLAVAEQSVEHNIPWLDTAVDEYFALERVKIQNSKGEQIERRTKGKKGNFLKRTVSFLAVVPKRFVVLPIVFLCKGAYWNVILDCAAVAADCGIKGAESAGLKGLKSGLKSGLVRMVTTPPRAAMFRFWTSRGHGVSDLTAEWELQRIGINVNYLEGKSHHHIFFRASYFYFSFNTFFSLLASNSGSCVPSQRLQNCGR